jgi:hypothetical protein
VTILRSAFHQNGVIAALHYSAMVGLALSNGLEVLAGQEQWDDARLVAAEETIMWWMETHMRC